MHVTTTPSEKSTVLLEVELPAADLSRAVVDATQRLSQRTRIPGFRPGKAPRSMVERELGPGSVLDEAVEQLVERSYRTAMAEQTELFAIGRPTIDVVQVEEGQPFRYTATIPVRPEVRLGDYRAFPFAPEIDTVDDPKVDRVVDELRDQLRLLGHRLAIGALHELLDGLVEDGSGAQLALDHRARRLSGPEPGDAGPLAQATGCVDDGAGQVGGGQLDLEEDGALRGGGGGDVHGRPSIRAASGARPDRAGGRGGGRTLTSLARHRLLRPARLPFRHSPVGRV